MMNLTILPKSFWGYALESAARILNMVPTKKVERTPYEIWHGKAPKLSYLRVWGCEALIKRDTPDKLDPRFIKCIFVGYPKETMGYYFYNPLENKIFVALNVEFFENSLTLQEASGSHGLLEASGSDVHLKSSRAQKEQSLFIVIGKQDRRKERTKAEKDLKLVKLFSRMAKIENQNCEYPDFNLQGLGGETGTETWVELGGFGDEMVALGVDLGVEIEVKVASEEKDMALGPTQGDKQEIVYRDIKSANILLGENLDASIGDFGLYKFLSMNEKHKGKAGTPVYMDPQYAKEVLSDGTELWMRLPAVVPRLHKAVNRNGRISYIHYTK
ncbi:retrovirus-related pol polyprotein from transposon TNT 1-94 [Tanacetum coccineum]